MNRYLLLFSTALSLACTGCDTPGQTTASAISKSNLARPIPTSSAIATAALPAPSTSASPRLAPASSPAYVLVSHVGVLQITSEGSQIVLPIPKDKSSFFTNIAVSPTGNLWLSDSQGIRIRHPNGDISTPRSVKDGPIYGNLRVRSDNDAWAATNDSEWSIVHYDGTTWTTTGQRNQFSGKYDDNKLDSVAATSEGVWISSWNGVWRGVGQQWEKISLPPDVDIGASLLTYRDQLIVANPGIVYLRKSAEWKKLAWPEAILMHWVVSDLGIFAVPHRDNPRVWIGDVESENNAILSDPIDGIRVQKLAIDASKRVWMATDQSLAVVDRQGHLLAQWPTGTLTGLTGNILDIAVVGTGPTSLPPAQKSKKWTIKGQFVLYKSRKPLVGASLWSCPSAAENCTNNPKSMRTSTDAQGAFQFSEVAEGDSRISVQPPPKLTDCETPFTVTDAYFAPGRDCHDSPDAPNICDLGTITTCLPFEMPPPPPR